MPRYDAEALAEALRTAGGPLAEEALVRLNAPAPAPLPLPQTAGAMAARLDHTQLRPEATPAQVRALCEETRRHGFATACVAPSFVPLAAEVLAGAPSAVCTTIGFPHGTTLTTIKAEEAQATRQAGAEEIDMVLSIGRLKGGEYDEVRRDIKAVVDAAGGAPVKVILETALLTGVEKAFACVLARQAGAHFVKTSTGFAGGGATTEDVALMRQMVGPALGVKASGGVGSFAEACRMIEAGASRIGASGSVEIVEGAPPEGVSQTGEASQTKRPGATPPAAGNAP